MTSPGRHMRLRINGRWAGEGVPSWHMCPFIDSEMGHCVLDSDARACAYGKTPPEWCHIRNGGIWVEGVEVPGRYDDEEAEEGSTGSEGTP